MKILIYEKTMKPGRIWQRFLTRFGFDVHLTNSIEDAAQNLSSGCIGTFIVDDSDELAAITTLTDLASYSNPGISIIAVTSGQFFTDGSIFELIPNVRSCISKEIELNDLGAMVEHYASNTPATPYHAVGSNQ